MITPPRRLCIVETLNPGASWLGKVETLARGWGAALELCAADVEHFISASWATQSGAGEYRAALAARRREDLARLVQPLRARGVDAVTGTLLPAPLERSVMAHVVSTRPGLVIKSTQHAPIVPVAALLQTDWMLAHALSAPLLLLGGEPWPSAPVVAVMSEHGSDPDRELMATARQVCAALAGTLETVPARWSDASHLTGDLHGCGASLVAMSYAALHTVDAAARILDEVEADLLIAPQAANPRDP